MAQQPAPTPTPTPIPTVKMRAKAGFEGKPVEMDINPAVGDLKPWDLDTKFSVMKGRYPRLEGPLKVTGRAKYTYDIKLPGMLWGRMVGSSVPHAEVVKIDTSKAEALPGVKAVWTTESRTVRFAGQDVAAVAATTPEIALDAARLIEITYNEKPFITDLEKAMEAGAPPVYSPEQVPGNAQIPRNGNILGPQTAPRLRRGDVVKGLAEADVSLEATYRVSVHTHAPLEPHGVIAQWEGDELTIYASTQGVFTVKEGVSEALAHEVATYDIRMLLVKHSGLRTDWARSASHVSRPIAAYDDTPLRAMVEGAHSSEAPQAGNPAKAAEAIYRDVKRGGPNLHLPLGAGSILATTAKLDALKAEYAALEELARSVDDAV